MKKLALAVVGAGLVAGAIAGQPTEPAEMPEFPQPGEQHQWLQQLTGEWTTQVEAKMDEDSAPITSEGVESVRSIGGFWVVAENTGDFMGAPFTGVLTLGYDTEKGHYVGTWIDSMSDRLWTYHGSLDASGRKLTLETEGPCPLEPGRTVSFKETIEIKSRDHKVFTSAFQDDDGSWATMLTIDYRRKN
jgi:hypothetical protein